MCQEFKDNYEGGTHYCELEGQHMWQMMFYNSEGESCAVKGTDDEVARLLTDDVISNTFVMIGDSAIEWEDEEKRQALLDKALRLIDLKERGHDIF
jgi:D-tyrosyl-tRNA(Tyr) deacylase